MWERVKASTCSKQLCSRSQIFIHLAAYMFPIPTVLEQISLSCSYPNTPLRQDCYYPSSTGLGHLFPLQAAACNSTPSPLYPLPPSPECSAEATKGIDRKKQVLRPCGCCLCCSRENKLNATGSRTLGQLLCCSCKKVLLIPWAVMGQIQSLHKLDLAHIYRLLTPALVHMSKVISTHPKAYVKAVAE